jgi:hypothetical protein
MEEIRQVVTEEMERDPGEQMRYNEVSGACERWQQRLSRRRRGS